MVISGSRRECVASEFGVGVSWGGGEDACVFVASNG